MSTTVGIPRGTPASWMRSFHARKYNPDEIDAEPHAAKNFRMWHQKDPREALHIPKFVFPVTVGAAGRAVCIWYMSDKWEPDGKLYPYVHPFDTHPTAYVADSDAKPRDVAVMLHESSVNSAMSVTLLGFAFAFTYDDGDEEHELTFRTPLPLICGRTKRVIVLLDKQQPIFVTGGKMRVTERGIVG